ncbi:hypothetical protein LCGC14_2959520, partial [marine sediment metagenome]
RKHNNMEILTLSSLDSVSIFVLCNQARIADMSR